MSSSTNVGVRVLYNPTPDDAQQFNDGSMKPMGSFIARDTEGADARVNLACISRGGGTFARTDVPFDEGGAPGTWSKP